jgi:Phytanoyl-CoA dioxygenase (PhyH)
MASPDPARAFEEDGFAILPGYLSPDDVGSALGELEAVFPTAAEFHDNVAPERNERFRDEFGGIVDFPFVSPELSLLAVHPRLVDLAHRLLGTKDLRVYSIEAWAKYTGAADYDQSLHRDYLNHSLLVPAPDQSPAQVEMFVYLCDVPAGLGPPSYVPVRHTRGLPALPNWYPQRPGVSDADRAPWDRRGLPHRDLPPRHGPGRAPRGPVHDPRQLPPGRRRLDHPARLDRRGQLRGLARLRGAGLAGPARAVRLPAAGAPLVEPRDARRAVPPLPRHRHQPVGHGVSLFGVGPSRSPMLASCCRSRGRPSACSSTSWRRRCGSGGS